MCHRARFEGVLLQSRPPRRGRLHRRRRARPPPARVRPRARASPAPTYPGATLLKARCRRPLHGGEAHPRRAGEYALDDADHRRRRREPPGGHGHLPPPRALVGARLGQRHDARHRPRAPTSAARQGARSTSPGARLARANLPGEDARGALRPGRPHRRGDGCPSTRSTRSSRAPTSPASTSPGPTCSGPISGVRGRAGV